MTPSYIPLEAIQLLSETLSSKTPPYRDIQPCPDFFNTQYNTYTSTCKSRRYMFKEWNLKSRWSFTTCSGILLLFSLSLFLVSFPEQSLFLSLDCSPSIAHSRLLHLPSLVSLFHLSLFLPLKAAFLLSRDSYLFSVPSSRVVESFSMEPWIIFMKRNDKECYLRPMATIAFAKAVGLYLSTVI